MVVLEKRSDKFDLISSCGSDIRLYKVTEKGKATYYRFIGEDNHVKDFTNDNEADKWFVESCKCRERRRKMFGK